MNAPKDFDVVAIREAFPGLQEQVRGKPLVYLDNAASSQTCRASLRAVEHFHLHDRANVHRGVHLLSQRATIAYDKARVTAQRFLNAASADECIFVRGTTEAINLVASSWGGANVGPGDEILITAMEHHSNIVPWQLLAARVGARVTHIPMNERGELVLDDLDTLINDRTRIVALVHVSNALGTINPVKTIIEAAHAKGVPVLLDGAQAIPHVPVDVQELGCDFYALSGHKVFGPTGIGVLWGRKELLDAMPPYQGGGDMIRTVTLAGSTWAPVPAKFEAGTPNIAGVIGLGAAMEWLMGVDRAGALAHENALLAYATDQLGGIEGLRLVGTAADKASVVSFVLDDAHAHDVGTILDMSGVAVRTGHHCTQPIMDFFGVPATARASLSIYNTHAEVDALVEAVGGVVEMFRR